VFVATLVAGGDAEGDAGRWREGEGGAGARDDAGAVGGLGGGGGVGGGGGGEAGGGARGDVAGGGGAGRGPRVEQRGPPPRAWRLAAEQRRAPERVRSDRAGDRIARDDGVELRARAAGQPGDVTARAGVRPPGGRRARGIRDLDPVAAVHVEHA